MVKNATYFDVLAIKAATSARIKSSFEVVAVKVATSFKNLVAVRVKNIVISSYCSIYMGWLVGGGWFKVPKYYTKLRGRWPRGVFILCMEVKSG